MCCVSLSSWRSRVRIPSALPCDTPLESAAATIHLYGSRDELDRTIARDAKLFEPRMIVRCVATELTPAEARTIGGKWPKREFGLQVAREYVVLGMTFA